MQALGRINYKLVHASPVENYMSSYWYSRDYKDQREFAVWERWGKTKPIPEGDVLIFGHKADSQNSCKNQKTDCGK